MDKREFSLDTNTLWALGQNVGTKIMVLGVCVNFIGAVLLIFYVQMYLKVENL